MTATLSSGITTALNLEYHRNNKIYSASISEDTSGLGSGLEGSSTPTTTDRPKQVRGVPPIMAEYLKSLGSIRERTQLVLQQPQHLQHFDVHLDQMDAVVNAVMMLIVRDYSSPTDIPPHSRWRHFEAASAAMKLAKCDRINPLLESWKKEMSSKGRSDTTDTTTGTANEPDEREPRTEYFGSTPASNRPGNLVDYLLDHSSTLHSDDGQSHTVNISLLWHVAMGAFAALAAILAARSSGSSTESTTESTTVSEADALGLVPFHKLSQWLTYSLMEPLSLLGVSFAGADLLTGLAEYRNGGLFVDMGVISLRDSSIHMPSQGPESVPSLQRF
ncbi:hypothetical protein BSLG_004876 [Batrachochytrium salamandrivorans]|nr:hypothetical protein BSLG_004876 [Batrachochytrium salamandrivorans]